MDDLSNPKEPLIEIIRTVMHAAVRVLAVLMTPPFMLLPINDILALFEAFMAV